MPYAARKRIEWGPRVWDGVKHAPLILEPGDEVPTPFKRQLLHKQIGLVDEVDAVAGKRWADQPEEYRAAWHKAALASGVHPTQLVLDEQPEPAPVEAMAPARSEPQEVAVVDEPAAPPTPAPKRRGRPKGSKNRGKAPR